MKTILQLLTLLLVRLETEMDNPGPLGLPSYPDEIPMKAIFNGMCNTIIKLSQEDTITDAECNLLSDYIHANKPKDAMLVYWWEPVTKEKRIEWLQHHVEMLERKDEVEQADMESSSNLEQ